MGYGTDGRCSARTPMLLPCLCQAWHTDHGDSFLCPGFEVIFTRAFSQPRSAEEHRPVRGVLVIIVSHQLEVGR